MITQHDPQTKFPLGKIYLTRGAFEALGDETPATYLDRHASGDWGELCQEDKNENKLSLEEGFRVMSAYTIKSGKTIWILTESDRSATTILLPEEY